MNQATFLEIIDKALASPTTLWIVLVSGVLLFLLMTREMVVWFFRVSTVLKKLEELQIQMNRLEESLSKAQTVSTNKNITPIETVVDGSRSPTSTSTSFPLQH